MCIITIVSNCLGISPYKQVQRRGNVDPAADAPVDPATDAPVDPAADAPVDRADNAPVDRADDAPVDPATDTSDDDELYAEESHIQYGGVEEVCNYTVILYCLIVRSINHVGVSICIL